jgi:hypothetical protein
MGSLKLMLGLFIIVGGGYAAAKLMPPYFENYQFQDAVKDEAIHDTYSPKTENDIRDAIFKKAQEYDIPVGIDGIQVHRQGTQYNGMVIIHVPYVVHLDFPGYAMDLHFEASTENKGVL